MNEGTETKLIHRTEPTEREDRGQYDYASKHGNNVYRPWKEPPMLPSTETPWLAANAPARRQFHPSRLHPGLSGQIAVHTAENDPTQSEQPAKAVARFIQHRNEAGSYHAIGDARESILLVSYFATAFHVATHHLNRRTFGLSFACRTTDWVDMDGDTVENYIEIGAERAADMAWWYKQQKGLEIPPVWLTLEQVLAGHRGFFTHAEADPERRFDPGAQFPYKDFLRRYEHYYSDYEQNGLPGSDVHPPMTDEEILAEIRALLKENGYETVGQVIRDLEYRENQLTRIGELHHQMASVLS